MHRAARESQVKARDRPVGAAGGPGAPSVPSLLVPTVVLTRQARQSRFDLTDPGAQLTPHPGAAGPASLAVQVVDRPSAHLQLRSAGQGQDPSASDRGRHVGGTVSGRFGRHVPQAHEGGREPTRGRDDWGPIGPQCAEWPSQSPSSGCPGWPQTGGSGGAEGIRTPDLLIANETRYQLRHSPRC